MIGSSMFIFSVSALIYSVSPARAENVFKAKSNGATDPFFVVVNGVVYYATGLENGSKYASFEKCWKQPGK
jgi:hypothetical protein